LRRHLLDRAEVDEITGLDNRLAIFPVHRSVRFVLLTCTAVRSMSIRSGTEMNALRAGPPSSRREPETAHRSCRRAQPPDPRR
jgi:hypothetical protein